MNSVLLAAAHHLAADRPRAPVRPTRGRGRCAIAHTRTFKLAAELRRSRSRATVPTFLVGGTAACAGGPHEAARAGATAGRRRKLPLPSRMSDRSGRAATCRRSPPSRSRRSRGTSGGCSPPWVDTWGRLPERLSGVSSSGPKTPAFSPSANGTRTGTRGPQGRNRQSSNGKASTHSWAGAGGKGSTSRPGGWTPASLNGPAPVSRRSRRSN